MEVVMKLETNRCPQVLEEDSSCPERERKWGGRR